MLDKRYLDIGEETCTSAIESLSLDVDGQTIAKWIENFIVL